MVDYVVPANQTSSGITLSSGDTLEDYGSVIGATVSGGIATVEPGGSVTSGVVEGGGLLIVSSGGTISSSTVSSGGTAELYGGAIADQTDTVVAGGTLEAISGFTFTWRA